MKKLILFMVMCMSVIACTTRNGYNSELNRVQKIINDSPKKALELTQEIRKKGGLTRSQEMRCLLLNMQAQDKTNTPVATEEDAMRCVKFYEANGCNNDKALAYYLLGCVYRDMHDAPMALEYYLKAVNAADTVGKDCDPQLLCTIYGQIEYIYFFQNLPQEELKALERYKKYADMQEDIYQSLIARVMFERPYFLLGQKDSCIRTSIEAYKNFMIAGYNKNAAMSLPFPIHIYIEREDYEKAAYYLNKYDSLMSGDVNPHSILNYYKGLTALHYGETEKAGSYFKTLIGSGEDEAAYRGMMLYYQKKRDIDSVVKYANLYADANDTMHARMRNNTIEQMSALYDYSRYQIKAKEEEAHAAKLAYTLLITIAISFVIILFGSYIYRRYKRKKAEEISNLQKEYESTVEKLNNCQADYNTLTNDHQALLEQKKKEIEQLEKQKAEYEELYKELKVEDDERKFITSDVVKKFHNMAMPKRNQQLPTKKDWANAFLAAEQHLPAFYTIAQWSKLTDKESKILLLIRMGIKNPGIKIIMGDISDQIVTNAKATINKKLFDDGKAGTIECNIKRASRRKN